MGIESVPKFEKAHDSVPVSTNELSVWFSRKNRHTMTYVKIMKRAL